MADALDVMYRLRDMASKAADKLRAEITTAQVTLDRLDQFAHDFEESAQLAAASDIFPTSSALIPPISGLMHAPTPDAPDMSPDHPLPGNVSISGPETNTTDEEAGHGG